MNGFDETFPFAFKEGAAFKFEYCRHEVVVAGTLFESSNEVGDGNREFGWFNDRRVEQQTSRRFEHRSGLALRHSEEHLEFDSVTHAATPREFPRECDIKKVVTCNTNTNVGNVVGAERVVDDALVVCVCLLLGSNGCELPAVHFGINGFHG